MNSAEFFTLNSKLFPRATCDLLPLSFLIQNGVLPLGIKGSKSPPQLNLGLLGDCPRARCASLEAEIHALVKGVGRSKIKPYSISASGFLAVLTEVYQFSKIDLENLPEGKVHSLLKAELTIKLPPQA